MIGRATQVLQLQLCRGWILVRCRLPGCSAEADIEQLCPDSPDGAARTRCLQQRAKQLPPLCQSQLHERFVEVEGKSKPIDGGVRRGCQTILQSSQTWERADTPVPTIAWSGGLRPVLPDLSEGHVPLQVVGWALPRDVLGS